jgi:hypothetical protein
MTRNGYQSFASLQRAEGRAEAESIARDIARNVRTPGPARHGVPFRHPLTGEWCVRR